MLVSLSFHYELSSFINPGVRHTEDKLDDNTLAIGSLMYARVCTRRNIGQAMGVVSRIMANPSVLWYLQGYVNIDFRGEVGHRKSTTGLRVGDWQGNEPQSHLVKTKEFLN